MADVNDTATAPEPSMEEILASIRKIIADENGPSPPAALNSDVVELTQMVQDDGSIVDLTEQPTPAPPEPEPELEPVKTAPPAPPPPPPPPVFEPEPVSALVSENTVSASASALSSLVNTMAIERLSSPHAGAYLGNGSRTLEDMVIELMRPMLKQWLDENLSSTVDRLVQKEIERIARRAHDEQ